MTEATRKALTDELHELDQDLLEMASAVEQMLHKSVEALRTSNVTLAREAMAMDDVVDEYNIAIENKCLRLLALQQPMAGDLRVVATTLKIITDIERMGDYVVDIAKTAVRLADRELFKPLVDIPRMAELVKQMLRETLEAFVNQDMELLKKMIEDDDEVDRLNHVLRAELIGFMKQDAEVADQAMQLLLVALYLERLADHVTNVGERVYHMETGELKELHKSSKQ